MTSASYRITDRSLTLYLNGDFLVLTQESHPRYDEIKEAILSKKYDLIPGLVKDRTPPKPPEGVNPDVLQSMKGISMDAYVVAALLGVSEQELDVLANQGIVVRRVPWNNLFYLV